MAEASTLRLSYKNVLKIDNLQGFSRLTKLCLDNNIIESIRFDNPRLFQSLAGHMNVRYQQASACRHKNGDRYHLVA